jgi:hypothetical protein
VPEVAPSTTPLGAEALAKETSTLFGQGDSRHATFKVRCGVEFKVSLSM